MDTELELELYKIDPIFFEEAINCLNGSMNQMDTCMYWGCECGNGWFEQIKKLANKTKYLNELGKKYNVKFVCVQIKEKYGEFTCYTDYKIINDNIKITNEDISCLNEMLIDAIQKCEKECWNVCEFCGAKGGINGENLITTTGYISRICKECSHKKSDKNIKN